MAGHPARNPSLTTVAVVDVTVVVSEGVPSSSSSKNNVTLINKINNLRTLKND